MSEFKPQIHLLRGKLLNFFVLQFPYMVCGDNDSSYLFGWMSGFNELMYVKRLKRCLA